ncbi:MAG TPA: beta-propeller fold lactonase family protein, partial [Bryobacteraceae bacterium]|nr:beta-propeller fold lactonase family protein [Bryobacteraceae bacterium]
MMRRFAFAAILACALSGAAPGVYLVLQKGASSLAWYTPEGKLMHSVPVGQHPHEMVLSRDRKLLYTTDNGTMKIEHAGTGGNTVSVIDVAGRKRVAQISTGEFRRPHGIDIDKATGRIAVSTELPDKLLIIDPAKRAVVKTYDTKGKTSHMVTFGHRAEYAYVSNSSSGNVAAVRLSDGEVKLIPTGTRPEDSVLSPDGRHLYVCNRESANISVIDTAQNAVVGQIATGKGPVRLEVSPDGKTLVYALMHDKQVGFADTASRKQTGTVSV